MERSSSSSSRSKRTYYYDQDFEPRTKPRYNRDHYSSNNRDHYTGNHHRRGAAGGRLQKTHDAPPNTVTTSYRILCHDIKAGGVIGKSGSIIKAIRQETGAWINVHHLIPGDEERIIEISDARRRDPDGRMPSFSPAQEALLMIHERILESDSAFGFRFDANDENDDDDRGQRVSTRLVVAKPNVGCLLGKGGKIIEQMRMETKTHIRILPRDHTIPQCVSMSEEIVQVVGDISAVKRAVAIMAARVRESQYREQSQFHGRLQSPERFFPPDDEFAPPMNSMSRRSSMDGPNSVPRFSAGLSNVRSNGYTSRSTGYAFDSEVSSIDDHAHLISGEDIVFRMLCPNNKVEKIISETDGIIELLRGEVGVEVRVNEPLPGSIERIITISSDEVLDDDLFPAQEALLHIQTKIADLGPEKDNITTTRLLIPSSEIGCLEGRDGTLAEMKKLTGANIQILPREELPMGTLEDDELVQIVGEIRAARDALVEVTARLRSSLCRELSYPKDFPPSISASGHSGSMLAMEADSPIGNPTREGYPGNDPIPVSYQNISATTTRPSKDAGGSRGGSMDRKENDAPEDTPSGLTRLSVPPLVTRSILEVTIPEYAMPKLMMRSGSKLAQISELSGATVKLVEDSPEQGEKIIRISGTPEQAERAQSLLQGFILSTQEDAPSS